MIKKLQSIIPLAAFYLILIASASTQACSVAGNVTASRDSVCFEDTVIVVTAGYTGNVFQWQSNDGSGWVNETGTGSATDTYTVIPGTTRNYRVIVTATGCPSDTSLAVTIEVGAIPVPTGVSASRCGYGQISLNGTGAPGGNLRWYAAASGGSPLGSGATFTTTVATTTTFYLEDNTYSGSGGASPLQITEFDVDDDASGGAGDDLELQNVSNLPVDVTGWSVAISNSYTDINLVNPNIQVLSGVLQPGDLITFNDIASSSNYWGSNILWNSGAFPGFSGWALILDNNNVLRDFVALNWPAANIQAMAPVVNGLTITIGSEWNGDGVSLAAVGAGQGIVRSGNSDNNSMSDFITDLLSINATNPAMTLPFQGFGCSSPRVPVVATVNPSTAVTLNSTASALCLGQSATLSVSSTSSTYAYSWFPSTGLSGTTGTSVTATPLVPTTYYVTGINGSCGAIDSVTISVGPTSVAGSAAISADTVCAGTNTTLTLTGSTGTIQWQSNPGSGWVNETGIGSNAPVYQFNPTSSASYWAIVTSGGCPSDTSNSFNVGVITVSNPVTTNDTVCAGGQANLQASGSGNLSWYSSASGGTLVNTGSTYSVNLPATTTFYVQSNDGGSPVHLGPANKSIGNQTQSTPNKFGLRFDATQEATIDSVSIYPVVSGPVIISLYDAAGTTLLNTTTVNVPVSSTVLFPVYLGFDVTPGTGYRLVLESGSVVCSHNSTGAVYPYSNASCPLSITGYFNPNAGTGTNYYYMYNWVVTDGCKSGLVPVTGVVVGPPQPTITALSGVLTSSPEPNYQWFLNGILIPGATSQSYSTTQPGAYTVQYADAATGCIITSDPYIVLSVFESDIKDAGVKLFPNPSADKFYLNFDQGFAGDATLRIFNSLGQLVALQSIRKPAGELVAIQRDLAAGTYQMELQTTKGVFHTKLIRQ